ncbi:MAG: tetratricopeptide repeat protein [Gammaproteobacteria bacterium]
MFGLILCFAHSVKNLAYATNASETNDNQRNKVFQSLDDSRNYFNRGLILAKNGNYGAAVGSLNIAINLDPKYVEAYIARASIAEKQGNFNAALIDYNNALNFRPSDQTFYNRGLIKLALKKFTDAILDFNNAIELNPLFAKAYHERGVALLAINMLTEAKYDFMRAFQLNPKLFSALEKTGDLNLIQKDYSKALENFNQLVTIKPKDPDLYFKRGQVYEFLGNYEKAFIDYQIAVDLYNNSVNNQQNKNYTQMNDYDSDEIQNDKSVIVNFVSQTVE